MRDDLVKRLDLACVGACDCENDARNKAIKDHHPICLWRVITEAKARIEALTAENAEMKTKLGNVRARSNRQRTSLANMEATNRRYKEEAKGAQRAVSEKAAENARLKSILDHSRSAMSEGINNLAAENARLTAENAKLREAAEQWLLMGFDDGSKVFLSSISGGGHPHGEFHTVILRKEMPGGAKFTRELVASSDWMPCVLTTESPQ